MSYLFSPNKAGGAFDIDTINSGILYVSNKSTGIPVAEWGWVLTLSDEIREDTFTHVKTQIFITVFGKMFFRVYNNSAWGSWQRIATT